MTCALARVTSRASVFSSIGAKQLGEPDVSYGLAEGLSFCVIGTRVIFLDLPRDRYFLLSGACEKAFKNYLRCPSDVAQEELELLRARTLLAADGFPPSACVVSLPSRSALNAGNRGIGWNVVLAAAAYFRASWLLKNRGLAEVVAHYRSVQFRVDPLGEESRRLATVSAFRSLRLILDPTDRCLPLSLAMAFELKRLRCHCDLVFGITLEPFRAHSWTQHKDQVLNDRLDRVLGFQPILVV